MTRTSQNSFTPGDIGHLEYMENQEHPNNSSSPYSKHWLLDPEILFLNHGSFGACPIPVLERQRALQDQLEREPVRFFEREYTPLLENALAILGDFVGADPADLCFVNNASSGVNAVLRSLRFSPGDEVLILDHAYPAVRNALMYVAEREKVAVKRVAIPFPIADPGEAVEAVVSAVTPRTRLAVLDHITSPTALVLPVETMVRELSRRGVETLVDGAHGPGMVDLDVGKIGAAFYTGNLHKWVCAPKGAAFLHVRKDMHPLIHPLTISNGARPEVPDPLRFRMEFDWTGTDDPTAHLCVPDVLKFMGSLLPGGWEELRKRNRELALKARDTLCEKLGLEPACPDEMIGSMASLILPAGGPPHPMRLHWAPPLQDELYHRYGIETVIQLWPGPTDRMIRLSAQLYNTLEQFQRLAEAADELLREERERPS